MLFDQGSKDTLHFESNQLYDLNYPINYLNEVRKIPFYCLKAQWQILDILEGVSSPGV